MSRLAALALATLATLCGAQAARAVVFDPSLTSSMSWTLPQTGSDESLTISIPGVFEAAVLGNYILLEPGGGTTVSDTINVSNAGAGATAQIILSSWETTVVTQQPTDILLGIEDASLGAIGFLDLPLANSNGTDLAVTVWSDTPGLPGGVSDQIDITVPEPLSLTLLGTALLALGAARRCRR